MQVALDDHVWAAGVATALVLTAPRVWNGVEQLPDVPSLDAFLARHDLADLAEVSGAVGTRGLAAVRRLRERVRALVDDPRPRRLVDEGTALTAACGGVTLGADEAGHAHWYALATPGADLAAQLALVCGLGVLGVVRSLGADRFRSCGAPSCGGAFIDTSRPGRRRYCMPERCGNRVNVANHRARRQADGRAIDTDSTPAGIRNEASTDHSPPTAS